VVTTLAGDGTAGSADTVNPPVRFNGPSGVAVDGAGSVYVADADNSIIRKITSAGAVTTLAGIALSPGNTDGAAVGTALFDHPSGVAVDSTGSLVYVTDTSNQTIRKIAAGQVTTLAGCGCPPPGGNDGTGDAARFQFPSGIAIDGAGILYVADSNNHTIRVITPGGVVTTFAGVAALNGSADGPGSDARFDTPRGVAVTSAGTLYVADTNNSTIRKITSARVVTTLAGSPISVGSDNGTGSAARFFHPSGVAVDSAGTIYVADTLNHMIRKIAAGDVVTTLAGSGVPGNADGTGTAAQFSSPQSVAVDSVGNVYVADTNNHTIRKITPAGVVTALAGTGVPGNLSADPPQFSSPAGVAVDSSGTVYVADSGNHAIRKITPAGVVTTLAGTGASGTIAANPARFNTPSGVAVDSNGNVYVADSGNHAIRRITAAGVVTTLAGDGTAGSGDTANAPVRFNGPTGVAVDGAGNVYVADTQNDTIRKITSGGVVTTFAGQAGSVFSADGAVRFNVPAGVAVDSNGTVYVADTNTNTIRRSLP
jgi:DNA-binding beta-propeller fold protein YncE